MRPSGSTARPSAKQIDNLVKRVQIALAIRGYDPGPVDGRLGGRTKSAVELFQAESGLASTGRLDAKTLAALGIVVE